MITRRQFIQSTCAAIPFGILSGCGATHYVTGIMMTNGISVLKAEFNTPNEPGLFREYIVVRNEKIEYPICVYRFSDSEYSAVLMKCTHQGTELQVAGDQLHCTAHGSEFSNRGKVSQGPAETDLRTFDVLPDGDKLLIALK